MRSVCPYQQLMAMCLDGCWARKPSLFKSNTCLGIAGAFLARNPYAQAYGPTRWSRMPISVTFFGYRTGASDTNRIRLAGVTEWNHFGSRSVAEGFSLPDPLQGNPLASLQGGDRFGVMTCLFMGHMFNCHKQQGQRITLT
jgi:hypothetical protein